MMRAIINCRVSTEDQARRGYSLPSQLDECRRYCEREGYTIVSEFSEDESGAKLDRPELTKVRDMLRTGQANALVLLASDRLTRSLAHHLLLRDELRRSGVELIYVQRGKVDNTPEATLTDNMAGVIAEYEREKIRERATRGIWTKAGQGRIVGMGGAPYGYCFDAERKLVPHEPEASIVRDIFRWYSVGDETGRKLSAYAIARRLSLDGVPTPAEGKNRRRRILPACAWNTQTVNAIIRNVAYAGVYRFGIRQSSETRREIIEYPIISLISRALWDAAKARATSNVANAVRNTRRFYLLRGRIKCGKCGRTMGGNYNTRSKRAYYGCRSRMDPSAALCRCTQPSIRTQIAEAKAWAHVLDVLTTDDLDAKIRDAQATELRAQHETALRLAQVEQAIADIEREARVLSAEISNANTGPLMRQAHTDRRSALESLHAAQVVERSALQAATVNLAMTEAQAAQLAEFRAALATGVQNATDEDKSLVLDTLNVSAIAKDYLLTVTVQLAPPDISDPIAIGNPRSKSRNCSRLSK